MDAQFWLGVLITSVIAVIINIVTQLFHPRLLAFLDARRMKKLEKSKDQALRLFNRTKAFHEGTKDRYPFYIMLATGAVLSFVAAAATLVIVFVRWPAEPDFALVLAFLFLCLSALCFLAIYATARTLEDFEAYRVRFEAQWGPTEEPPPSPRTRRPSRPNS